ncbi:MAG: hypothetical protein INR65_17905 [Gluconacetobacter diazotrophicus]|nr:hypothetical protein [Gluconacetobacter diazotrophicus]
MRRALRTAWDLRGPALFLLGPAAGVLLGAAIFGLPVTLRWLAGLAFVVSLLLFGLLVPAAWRDAGARRRNLGTGAAVRR